jgi:hypothetical protein
VNLDATTKSLEVLLGGAVTTNQLVLASSYVDVDATFAIVGAGENDLLSNNATAVTLVAAPAAARTRKISFLSVYNADTVPATVTVRINNNGTFRIVCKVTLAVGDTLFYGG